MSMFRDSNGLEWRVGLDAFGLADVKKDAGVDLADLSAGGWWTLETDAGAVGRVLAVVCGDEIRARKMDGRGFAKGIRGESITAARQALLDEGADFFPPPEWSAIRANLERRTQTNQKTAGLDMLDLEQATKILPLAEAFMRLDAETRRKIIDEENTALVTSADEAFAGGQETTQSTPAIDSPASAA